MLAGSGIFFFGQPGRPPQPPGRPVQLIESSGSLYAADKMRLTPAAVRHVFDGDTLEVLWEGKPQRLRYFGIDTPEPKQACHEEATTRNQALAGQTVLLAFDRRRQDEHGRLLAYAFTEQGLSIDAQLIQEGLGRAWWKDGKFRDMLVDLEKKARNEKSGCLWGKK